MFENLPFLFFFEISFFLNSIVHVHKLETRILDAIVIRASNYSSTTILAAVCFHPSTAHSALAPLPCPCPWPRGCRAYLPSRCKFHKNGGLPNRTAAAEDRLGRQHRQEPLPQLLCHARLARQQPFLSERPTKSFIRWDRTGGGFGVPGRPAGIWEEEEEGSGASVRAST